VRNFLYVKSEREKNRWQPKQTLPIRNWFLEAGSENCVIAAFWSDVTAMDV